MREAWLSIQAVDDESSGYFLVQNGELPDGWRWVSEKEASGVFGRGMPNGQTETDDSSSGGGGGCNGMAYYSFDMFKAAVVIRDTPLSYRSPVGIDVNFEITYSEASQIDLDTWKSMPSMGSGFMLNWFTYISEYRSGSTTTATAFLPDGRKETFEIETVNIVPHVVNEVQLKDVLEQERHYVNSSTFSVNENPTTGDRTYYRRLNDGMIYVYGHVGFANPASVYGRYQLTEIRYPNGNTIQINYSGHFPDEIVDSLGYTSTIEYNSYYDDYPTYIYYRVASITDPFGRTVTFDYDENYRLIKITDPVGIESEFTYSTGTYEHIDSLTTPYGTTKFAIDGEPGYTRSTTVTDPEGLSERVLFSYFENAPSGMDDSSESLEHEIPYGLTVDDKTLSWTNTFYWDKKLMADVGPDPKSAYVYHWMKSTTSDHIAAPVYSATKAPLENWVWYQYPNQRWENGYYAPGSIAQPEKIGRTVPDEDGYTTDGSGYVSQIYSFDYNGLANPTEFTDPAGRVTIIDYLTNGPGEDRDITTIQQTASGGDETLLEFTYSALPHQDYGKGLPATAILANGEVYTFTYNTKGQVTNIEDPEGNETKYTYDSDPRDGSASANEGYLVKVERTDPDNAAQFVTLYTLGYTTNTSGDMNVRSITDSEGYEVEFTWDNLDRLTSVTYPDSTTESYVYTASDGRKLLDPSFFVDRAGRTTEYYYNGNQQLSSINDPLGRSTILDWCSCGSLSQLVDAMGRVTTWQRDIQGRVTAKVFPDGTRQKYAWQPGISRLESYTTPNDVASGAPTAYLYYFVDNNLARINYFDAATPDVSWTYDDYFNRLATRVDGQGTSTYAYYPINTGDSILGDGLLKTIDGPWDDDTLRYSYDELNRLLEWEVIDDTTPTPVVLQSEEYTYDSLGRIVEVDNDLGQFDYAYIGETGLVDTIDYPNGQQVDYDYLANNQGRWLQTIKNLSKDNSPRVNISQFDYTYTDDGMIETWQRKFDAGTPTKYTFGYDQVNQLTSAILETVGASDPVKTVWGYDKAGNRTRMGIYDESGMSVSKDRESYSVNDLNQLTSIRDDGPAYIRGTVDELSVVTIDGKPANVSEISGSSDYLFEGEAELETDGSTDVTIKATDASGNTATTVATVTSTGELATLTYDANGNLTQKEVGSDVTVYQWDAANRLVAIQDAPVGSEASGDKRTEFEYDGLGRRVVITSYIWSSDWAQNGQQKYLWNGSRIAQQVDSRLYFDLGFRWLGNSENLYYTKDHLGSIREIVQDDGETVDVRLDYDPWGVTTVTNYRGSYSPDFGYTGHHLYDRFDDDLYLTWFRPYDPALGRWLTRDPIGERGGLNLYGYSFNNPVNYWDPLGLDPGDSFKSADCAALDSSPLLNGLTEKEGVEYGTTIYQRGPEDFSYSDPYTDNLKDKVQPQPAARPEGTDLAGFNHSQPYAPMSGDDYAVGKARDIPIYMTEPSGITYKFDPTDPSLPKTYSENPSDYINKAGKSVKPITKDGCKCD